MLSRVIRSGFVLVALLGGMSSMEARAEINETNRVTLKLPTLNKTQTAPAFLRLTNAEGRMVVINTNRLSLGRDLAEIKKTYHITNEIPLTAAQQEFVRTNGTNKAASSPHSP